MLKCEWNAPCRAVKHGVDSHISGPNSDQSPLVAMRASTPKRIAAAASLEDEMCRVREQNKRKKKKITPTCESAAKDRSVEEIGGVEENLLARTSSTRLRECVPSLLTVTRPGEGGTMEHVFSQTERQKRRAGVGKGARGAVRQFLPAGSYLTSSINMPAKTTCSPAIQPPRTPTTTKKKPPTHFHIISALLQQAFYPPQALIQQRLCSSKHFRPLPPSKT